MDCDLARGGETLPRDERLGSARSPTAKKPSPTTRAGSDGRMHRHDGLRQRTLEIAFLESEAEAYSFTFGSSGDGDG